MTPADNYVASSRVVDADGIPMSARRPDRLYPAGAGDAIDSPSPPFEGDEIGVWPRDLPALAARVRIPVRYSLGDHETVWRSGPAALAEIAALFTASPRVVTEEQPGSGHNLSLGLAALAYHLKVLAFAEECALAREKEDSAELGLAHSPQDPFSRSRNSIRNLPARSPGAHDER